MALSLSTSLSLSPYEASDGYLNTIESCTERTTSATPLEVDVNDAAFYIEEQVRLEKLARRFKPTVGGFPLQAPLRPVPIIIFSIILRNLFVLHVFGLGIVLEHEHIWMDWSAAWCAEQHG